MIGDISGTLSASRNLQANINKLRIEKQRQQELLYQQDFQIQQMERRVSRMQGDRSHDEQQKLEKEIRDKNTELEKHKRDLALLATSNKQLLDEKRNITKVIEKVKNEKMKITNVVSELRLENEMIRSELEKVIKTKEKTLVSYDVMKLEIKKLRDTVNLEADKVYGLENRKYQLEMSMEEREKEI